MTTQYTSILKLALPVQGELSGTWGDTVNDNITSMVEEAIAGRSVINSWTANSHTLTTADGTTSESRAAMLEFTDTGAALSGNATVICPTASKIYIAKNAVGSSRTVTLKTSAGTGIAIPDGTTMFLFCDGTNVVEAVTNINSFNVGGTVAINAIKDEDDMSSDSATALATQQSIKAYVDSQVGSFDTLAEVLAQGNTTGGTDIAVGTGDDITFADSSKAIFGAGSDLSIYHDGSNSYIDDQGTGGLYIRSSSNMFLTAANGEKYFRGTVNGAATFYYDDAEKLATTSTGIDVTGTVTADGLTVESAGTIQLTQNTTAEGDLLGRIEFHDEDAVTGDGGVVRLEAIRGGDVDAPDFQIISTTNGGVLTNRLFLDSATGNIGIGTTSPEVSLQVLTASNTIARITAGTSSIAGLDFGDADDTDIGRIRYDNSNNSMAFTVNAAERMRLDSSGNVGIGTSSPSYKVHAQGTDGTAASIRAEATAADSDAFIVTDNDANAWSFGIDGDTSDAWILSNAFGLGTPAITVGTTGNITQTNTSAGSGEGPLYNLYRNSASPAANDDLGVINFKGKNDAAEDVIYATIESQAVDVADATEDGRLFLTTIVGGTKRSRIDLRATETVVNEGSLDLDFRVESDGNANMIFVDASLDTVGIGTGSPSSTYTLDVGGPIRSAGAAPSLTLTETDASNQQWIVGTYGGNLALRDVTGGTYPFQITTNAPTNSILIQNGALTVNDNSADQDFRVESNNNSHMLFVDASADAVAIGHNTPLVPLHIQSTNTGEIVRIESTDADASQGPILALYRNSASPAASDGIGRINFLGEDSAGNETTYNYINATITDATDGSEDSKISIGVLSGGAARSAFYLDGGSGAVFNEDGIGAGDFRVESNNNANMIFVDAGNDRVGVGTTPSYTFHALSAQSDGFLFSSSHATTTNFYISNTNATANNTANLYFSPANAVAGAYISAIAIEDFSTSANRTADLAFYTRKDGTFGERVRIDSSGRLLVASSTAVTGLTTAKLQLNGSDNASSTMSIGRFSADASSPVLNFVKSRNATVGGNTIVQDGDNLGSILFSANDGVDNAAIAAKILGEVDGTPGADDMPGRLTFSTTADGAASPTERMRIDSSGNLLVGKTSSGISNSGFEVGQSGQINVTQAGAVVGRFNRKTSDGSILELQRDGTTVGSIGVTSSDNLYIAANTADHAGLLFGTHTIYPMEAATLTGGTIDLGASATKFKDLYLSGGLYVGGAVAANYLDDYEEGTWTPTYTTSNSDATVAYTTQRGKYTKVGNLVFITWYLELSTVTSAGTGNVKVAGVPFQAESSNDSRGADTFYNVDYDSSTFLPPISYLPSAAASALQFLQTRDNGAWAIATTTSMTVSTNDIISGSMTFRV